MTGPQRLGRHLTTIAGKALGKHGLAFGALLTDWPSIVGARLAEQTSPLKLAFPPGKRENATLHLRVSGGAALLIQHEEPLIIERINASFGWHAVTRLKLVQGGPTLKPFAPPPRPKKLPPETEQLITTTTAAVPDEELRHALERFGRAIAGG